MASSIRLMPSENVMSPEAKIAYSSDIEGRYHTDFYAGKSAILQLFEYVTGLAKQVFRSEYAHITPISGNTCDLSALIGFSRAGDKVALLPWRVGGYLFNIEQLDRQRVDLPFDEATFNIDLPATLDVIRQERPALVILGASYIMHPIPGVQEIASAVHDAGGVLAYDGAHPFGLIAGGEFQDPLAEGVDLLFGSTHKSFFGPQGGIIVTNEETINARLEVVVGADPFAGVVLVDNPNLARIGALGVALEEMLDHGQVYAQQVIANARALHEALAGTSLGNHIAGPEGGPTDSHQVVINIKDREEGMIIMHRLEAHGIFCDAGIRFGTAESTRLGYRENDMIQIGRWVGDILEAADDTQVSISIAKKVNDLAAKHAHVML